MSAHFHEHPRPGEMQFELKAGTFTLPVLRLLGTDMDAVARQLSLRVGQAAGFFHNAPMVIDLKALAASDAQVEFPLLVGLMRGLGMVPVGVRGGNPAQNAAAQAMELVILADQTATRPVPAPTPTTDQPGRRPTLAPPPRPVAPPAPSGMVVSQPVRSGQCLRAEDGDLILLAQVSSGAEVMAEGHIHIYAPLRGRAQAGMKGNVNARIFCQNLQAELVSVAGYYRISENIDSSLWGRAVQVYLKDRTLHIERI